MLIGLMLLPPFIASLLIALGMVSGWVQGERSEWLTSRISLFSVMLSASATGLAVFLKWLGVLRDSRVYARWLESGGYHIDFSFSLDGLSLSMAVLICVLSILVLRFSINYMHRESGFHRFFMILSLFVGAMLLLVLAGNAALAFIAWELAGLSSYLLIAYAYDRPVPPGNATRAFVTNRIGDAGFVLGIALSFVWAGGIEWSRILIAPMPEWQGNLIAFSFLLAAAVKSAQIPFSPWLARAMEGPTPSSAIFYGAIMVHAGVYLMLRLQPLLEHTPWVMNTMAAMGLITALYGFLTGLSQTDVKSSLIFSTLGQVGLMFLSAGLGFWRLATWHLIAHAIFRAYQFLTSPWLIYHIASSPQREAPRLLPSWLYVASLQRFWIESLGDWMFVKPLQRLSSDIQAFDQLMVEKLFGLPALPSAESLADWQNRPSSRLRRLEVTHVSGFPGKMIRFLAEILSWFEERLVLEGRGDAVASTLRRLGSSMDKIEAMLSRPRYLVLLIIVSLLMAFK